MSKTSTRRADGRFYEKAAIDQLFVEGQRHQPSVIYMPSLLRVEWCAAVSGMSRSTMRATLESLSPTDPMLLLAIVDGPFSSLPCDLPVYFSYTIHILISVLVAWDLALDHSGFIGFALL
ncbi:hypothetical protein BU15DRAFT_62839 [Melanogaster broomeanus]|nr:hypothetical protein BU15DRAFT_62839 [Melanogaster broomeanus]